MSAPGRHRDWFGSPRLDLLAGLVTALALIPEVISFSIVAGVDPEVGLYASFTISIVVAVTGGRPAMISAAAGSMAVVMAPLVRTHGLGFLFAATVLTGIVQLALGAAGASRLMRFVPRPVVLGFVNGLAILIFSAQLPNLLGEGAAVWLLAAVAVAAISAVPRWTTLVPAPLIVIVVLTVVVVATGLRVPAVGDMGELPSSLPTFALPDVPFTFGTLGTIAPYAGALALVGLLETLLTAQIVEARRGTPTNARRECCGQGLANVVTGLFGGMAGCAMIGQTIINVRSGGRSRLSTLAAGVFLLVLVVALGGVVGRIPMAALVGVMIVVSAATFDWSTIRPSTMRTMPWRDTGVMFLTVAVIAVTHNLAVGVIGGVLVHRALPRRRPSVVPVAAAD
jgi:SulP family sulfate permease